MTKIELLSLPLVQVLVAVQADSTRLRIAQHPIVVALWPLLNRLDRSDWLYGDSSIACGLLLVHFRFLPIAHLINLLLKV